MWLVDSFLNGEYKTVRTTAPIVLYRAYGNGAKKEGSFTTTEPPIDLSVIERRCAIKNEFNNNLCNYTVIQVPIGTVLQVGFVAPQLANDNLPNIPLCLYKGGAVQAVLPVDFFKNNPDAIIDEKKTPNFIRPIGAAALRIYAGTHDVNALAKSLLCDDKKE